MHYRSAVLVVIVVSLTLGAPLQAQITFVSPGAAASKAIREAAARQEDQRRQEERERIARERLALEERRVALQEQLIPDFAVHGAASQFLRRALHAKHVLQRPQTGVVAGPKPRLDVLHYLCGL